MIAGVYRFLRPERSAWSYLMRRLSSLAAGADQMFSEVSLTLGIHVVAVISIDGYEQLFDGDTLAKYRGLLERREPLELHLRGDLEHAVLEAGKFIVGESNLLIPAWDGEDAEGVGRTGDIVRFAEKAGKPIVHLNPCTKTIDRRDAARTRSVRADTRSASRRFVPHGVLSYPVSRVISETRRLGQTLIVIVLGRPYNESASPNVISLLGIVSWWNRRVTSTPRNSENSIAHVLRLTANLLKGCAT